MTLWRSSVALAIALAIAWLSLLACGQSDGGGSSDAPDASSSACGAVVPKACPTPTPSYAADIAPLVTRTCLPCHASGGVAADRDLTTQKGLVRFGSTVVVQVNGCLMPSADASPSNFMSSADRDLLLGWFVCGSPDN